MVDGSTEGKDVRIAILIAEMRGILEAIQNLDPGLKPYTDRIEKEVANMPARREYETPDVSCSNQDAVDYIEELGLAPGYVDNWHNVYPFSYYDVMLKGRCIGWKESLSAYADIVKKLTEPS